MRVPWKRLAVAHREGNANASRNAREERVNDPISVALRFLLLKHRPKGGCRIPNRPAG
jgi:hypothetical protein